MSKTCPDGGTCHHACGETCWRSQTCVPFTGYGDVWLSMAPIVDPGGERVTCATCKVEYVCSPRRDYYNATTLTDGVCEPCLLANAGIKGPVRVIDTTTPRTDG